MTAGRPIVRTRDTLSGSPRIDGTRLYVSLFVIRAMNGGRRFGTDEQIMADYPQPPTTSGAPGAAEWLREEDARMSKVTITLGRDGMGDDASEADFEAWTSYVANRIDDLTGLDVTVDERRRGDVQETAIDADDDVDEQSIHDAIETLWAEFCADPSAWPARTAEAG